jgi:YegS/Rv2252/BmrU family lipid kinase
MGRPLEIRPTERPRHAADLAREAAEGGAGLVLVCGGDGTVRDAAEGLAQVPAERRPPLALLPAGTGNDFSRTLGVPSDLKEALRTAFSGRTLQIDHWSWNDTGFVNVAGVGLDAAVAAEVNRRYRSMRGAIPYVLGLLAVLPRFKPVDLRLRWPEGEWAGRAWLAAVGSGRFYGGGMMIAPGAAPDDGLLEVVVVEDVSRLELLFQFPGIFRGAHVRHPRVRTFTVSELEVDAAPQDVTLDGELEGRTPARVRRRGTIPIRVPA